MSYQEREKTVRQQFQLLINPFGQGEKSTRIETPILAWLCKIFVNKIKLTCTFVKNPLFWRCVHREARKTAGDMLIPSSAQISSSWGFSGDLECKKLSQKIFANKLIIIIKKKPFIEEHNLFPDRTWSWPGQDVVYPNYFFLLFSPGVLRTLYFWEVSLDSGQLDSFLSSSWECWNLSPSLFPFPLPLLLRQAKMARLISFLFL